MNSKILIYVIINIFTLSGCEDHKNSTMGYIEDEYIYLSIGNSAEIKSIDVIKGDKVKIGDILFKTDDYTLRKTGEKLERDKKYEEAILRNMEKGIRKSERELIDIDIDRLQREIVKAESTLERKRKLRDKGFLSKEDIESEELNLAIKRNSLKKITADLNNKMLPARIDELIAQKIKIEKIDVDVENNKYNISQSEVKSPADGIIHDILRKKGELASPSNPVLIIVPDGRKKIKFYINRNQLYKIKISDSILVRVNDFNEDHEAIVDYISPKPEYTPPMLYDDKNDTFVYLIEAKFKDRNIDLPAGTPVEIML
ncbi:HlyD family secretion protein [Rosenbergiella epipactidis]|uniref:HlyD family secretion protein n=1 Tax=Rosenbergiella epipactidis TaxID=1544694 RepID=UPI002025DF75|nr:HlyD family efflux transporter periplasmic adaptor subunit [Rosenbergiella epipactidis]MCL9669564.1 HlyD family secretion protein [Rosenbergiella epipactidis]